MRISKLNVFKNVCCMSCIYIFLYVIQCYFQSHAATTHILHHRQVHVNLNFPEVSKWKRPMWDTWFYTQHHNYDYKLGTSNQLLDGFGMKYLAYAQSNHSENWVSIFLPHMRSDKKTIHRFLEILQHWAKLRPNATVGLRSFGSTAHRTLSTPLLPDGKRTVPDGQAGMGLSKLGEFLRLCCWVLVFECCWVLLVVVVVVVLLLVVVLEMSTFFQIL